MVDKSGEINWFDGTARSITPGRGVPAIPMPVKPDNRRRHTRFQVASTQVVLHRDGEIVETLRTAARGLVR